MAGEEGRLMMGWQSSLVPQPLLQMLMRLVVEGKGLIKWLWMLQRDVSLKAGIEQIILDLNFSKTEGV